MKAMFDLIKVENKWWISFESLRRMNVIERDVKKTGLSLDICH